MDFNKIQNFSIQKGIIQRAKRQAADWEKILANNVSDTGIYEEPIMYPQNLIIRKQFNKTTHKSF